jgi:DNA-binding response OmpR family regulator
MKRFGYIMLFLVKNSMNKTLKILIVEDNPVNALFVQELLSRAPTVSFEFSKAATLAVAVETIKNQKLDIILLDLDLPDSQGYATFQTVNSLTSAAPIIILSSVQEQETAIRAVQEGAQDYFIKGSFEGNLLIRAILFAVERKQKEKKAEGKNDLANRQLALQLSITTILAKAQNFNNAAHSILQLICEVLEWQVGEIWAIDRTTSGLRYVANWQAATMPLKLELINQETNFKRDQGLAGYICCLQAPYWIADMMQQKSWSSTDYITHLGLKSGFGFPIVFENETLGVMLFFSDRVRDPDPNILSLFATIGKQIGAFIKHKRIEGDLLYLTQHDLLTGLANRAMHEDSINTAGP